ncbi:MAG: aminotransferase [Gammaproteobacteria bacterium RIFCSPLOWO2_02_FULL_61_13]|nr:MAG: aminotransferase [Gammaproteobacteria bacterium RIFCSPLOWO2_02_FULL_61_13]
MFADLPFWAYLIMVLALTHTTIACVTIFLHRHQAHRAIHLHPIASHFFRFWLWLTTGIVTREWVAIHRKHHARVETADDPHSPRQLGIRKVLTEGAELYRREARNTETLVRFGHATPDDWLERNVYGGRSWHGILIMLALNLGLFGAPGLTIWAVQMMWIPFFAAGVINGAGHYWGYRNFESPDASTNIIPFGILIGGEELHNNHHAFASSARFSSRWYEFDLGWCYIRVMQAMGLARVRKLPPVPLIDRGKQHIDLETVQAVIENQLHVMAQYARDVIGTVYEEERASADRAARALLRRGRRLLWRHERLVDASGVERLEALLERHPALRVAYEYRQRLQALWQERTASHDSLLEGLRTWCEAAESTGIKALQEFARKLRSYTLQAA